jgi:hypothetical protein
MEVLQLLAARVVPCRCVFLNMQQLAAVGFILLVLCENTESNTILADVISGHYC